MKNKSFLSEDQVILNWCLGLYADLRMKAAGLLLVLLVQKKIILRQLGKTCA